MFCSLIMAGGKGTRFWPKSTENMPKQFLSLIGEKTMIQMTYERLLNIMKPEQIFVVTCERYKNIVKEQIPTLPEENIIIEPVGRNTAACILLASLYIKQIYNDATIAVLPSDHAINNTQEFCKTLTNAMEYIKKDNKEAIVTIGITPNRPETGYGYIKYNKKANVESIIKVEKFVEKPDLEKAKKYLDAGNYLWNAGMFIFNVDYMLKELEKNYTDSFKILNKLPKINDKEYEEKLFKNYKKCESISIDYAVMEKSENIYVIPSNFGWDDIGTWNALQRYIKPDNEKNFIKGNVKAYNSKNNVVYAGDKKIILMDVDNIFCIESDDVIIIGKKERLSEIHELRNKF